MKSSHNKRNDLVVDENNLIDYKFISLLLIKSSRSNLKIALFKGRYDSSQRSLISEKIVTNHLYSLTNITIT